MTDTNYTHICVILDRSGSMQPIDADTVGGFNAFIEEQRKIEGRTTVTLVRFDNRVEVDYIMKPLEQVPLLKSVGPRGMTAMYDAIGQTINELGDQLRDMDEDKRPSKVMIVIITDGAENSSHKFSASNIRGMIMQQQSIYNWQFTYLGANQDAVLTGGSLGISPNMSATFSTHNTPKMFAAVSQNVASYRATGSACGYEETRGSLTQ